MSVFYGTLEDEIYKLMDCNIYVIQGLAGTGKSTKALELFGNNKPIVIVKTQNLKKNYSKLELCAITLAKFLAYKPAGNYLQLSKNAPEYMFKFCTEYLDLSDPLVPFKAMPFNMKFVKWDLISKDKKWTIDSITGEYASCYIPEYNFRILGGYIKDEKGNPVKLTAYFRQQKLFKRRYTLEEMKKSKTDDNFLFDDVGLFSETDAKILIELIKAGFFRGDIAVTYDPMQLSYGGEMLVKYLKTRRNSKRIYCDHEWRFDNQKYTWRNFTVEMLFDGTIPVIHQAVNKVSSKKSKYLSDLYNNIFKRSKAVGHSLRARNRAVNVYGFDERKTINVDKCQGREYDFIWLDLAGLAACGRANIPNWQKRVYTTMTRGKSFGFYVRPGTSKNRIREYCSWLFKMREWVINNSRLPSWLSSPIKSDIEKKTREFIESLYLKFDSVIKLKVQKDLKKIIFSYGGDGHIRATALRCSCRSRNAACSGGTGRAVPSVGGGRKKGDAHKTRKKNTMRPVINRPFRFWPFKSRTNARERLFDGHYV